MIISIKNNKGGVGKSWLTFNLGHGLSVLGSSVLIITSDSQNNVLDFAKGNVEHGRGLEDWVQKGDGDIISLRENLHYIPLESNNFSSSFREKLKNNILDFKLKYDYILIDSVPVLAIDKEFEEVANRIIIPIYLDDVSIKGTVKIIDSIIDKNKILGIVPNRFNRSKKERECYNDLKIILEGNKIKLFEPIQQLAFITELISKNKSIWESNSSKLKDTPKIIGEILQEITWLREK